MGTRDTLGTRLIQSMMTMTSCAQIRCSMRNYYLHQFKFLFLGQEPILFCVRCLGFCISVQRFFFLFRVLGFRFCLYAFFQGFARLFPGFECLFCITGIKENFQFFLNCMILFVFCDSGSCVSVLESVFLFWNWFSFFGFCGMYFPYRPPYIWPSFVCKSIHQRKLNSVKHFLTIQIGKRLRI